MGMNFYLEKKDGGTFIVPSHKLGDSLERLCVETYGKEKEKAIAIDLTKCVEEVKKLHIGKSSGGWNFGLCIYPSLNIYTLNDWEKMFRNETDYTIVDEEDSILLPQEMMETITDREAFGFTEGMSQEEYEKKCIDSVNDFEKMFNTGKKKHYETYDEYLKENNCTRGKKGLLQHCTRLWDERNSETWKNFSPMITTYIATDGTYDLTPDWDFS